jgi:hypothetical protein
VVLTVYKNRLNRFEKVGDVCLSNLGCRKTRTFLPGSLGLNHFIFYNGQFWIRDRHFIRVSKRINPIALSHIFVNSLIASLQVDFEGFKVTARPLGKIEKSELIIGSAHVELVCFKLGKTKLLNNLFVLNWYSLRSIYREELIHL